MTANSYRLRIKRRADLSETEIKRLRLGLHNHHGLPEPDQDTAMRLGRQVEYDTRADFARLRRDIGGLCMTLERVVNQRGSGGIDR